ncbi:MAG: MiaB/RimO family radical SAM methylthiotransferase, partial [Christensenellaceae bacterium]|nr:MiaB/RimO family radical SAM methylthiotransferase [Christensenellaceae bacterium]
EILVNNGVKEITLLGQNVNSYLDNDEKLKFPDLLKKLEEIGVPRIRFMTSHPKDLSDALIEVMANSRNIERHIHLPVQAGNSEVLKAMNRGYTKEQYLSLVEKLRKNIPDIGITTDIIVAFPNETEIQFQDTLDLVKKVQYDSAFTFIYSKRNGTKAAKMSGFIPKEIASDRLERLNKEINKISKNILNSQIGKKECLLIDGFFSDKNGEYLIGRTSRNLKVKVEENPEKIGEFVNVVIEGIEKNTLKATVI